MMFCWIVDAFVRWRVLQVALDSFLAFEIYSCYLVVLSRIHCFVCKLIQSRYITALALLALKEDFMVLYDGGL